MAGRTLENLQARYNTHAQAGMPGKGPGGPGKNRLASGKPKDAKKTIARIFSYVGMYKLRLIAAVFCLIATTIASLAGSYLLRPIMNHIAEKGIPAQERIAYLISMLAVLLGVYLVSVAGQYFQSRLMVGVSRNAVERIRRDLFAAMQ